MPDIDDDEKPLDPAVERVRRKLTVLILVSTGILGVGFLAVVFAIAWRVSNAGEPRRADVVELPISAADLVAASLSGDVLVLTVGGVEPRIEIRRRSDGALVQTFRLAR